MKPCELRPGQVVYYCGGTKLHYIGVAESKEDRVHVFWGWNRYKHRRYYETIPEGMMHVCFKYMNKKPDYD